MTNKKRKTDRKETLKKLNKKLFEENLNRLLADSFFKVFDMLRFKTLFPVHRKPNTQKAEVVFQVLHAGLHDDSCE